NASSVPLLYQQDGDVSRVALALVIARIGDDLGDRNQPGVLAGQIAKGNWIVETDICGVTHRNEILLEKSCAMAGSQENSRRDQRPATNRKDFASRRLYDKCAGVT